MVETLVDGSTHTHTWAHEYLGENGVGSVHEWTCTECGFVKQTVATLSPCRNTPTLGSDKFPSHVWRAMPGVPMAKCCMCARVTGDQNASCSDVTHEWLDGNNRCLKCGRTITQLYE